MRRSAKRDANEKPIVEALRRIGANVIRLHEPCDLLVGFRKRTLLLEVKTMDGSLTKPQAEFFAYWRGEAYIVQNIEQAMAAVIGKDAA